MFKPPWGLLRTIGQTLALQQAQHSSKTVNAYVFRVKNKNSIFGAKTIPEIHFRSNPSRVATTGNRFERYRLR